MSTTATGQEKQETPKRDSKIARFFLPGIDPQSALLPPDRWLISNVVAILKASTVFKKNATLAAVYAGMGVVSIAAGIAGIILTAPAVVMMAAAAVAGIGLASVFGKKTRDKIDNIKRDFLPEMRKEIGQRYLKMKGDNLLGIWSERINSKKEQKAAAPDNTAAAAPAPTPTPEQAPKQAENPAEKPVAKPSIGNALGKWALKKAFEKKGVQKEPPKADAEKKPPAPPTP